MDVEEELQEYIVRNHLPDGERLQDGENLIASGILDSLGIAKLTEHLSERYGVSLGAEDFVLSNFSTLEGLAALVRRKQGPAGGDAPVEALEHVISARG